MSDKKSDTPIQEATETPKKFRSRMKGCCKKSLKFFFSNVGLCGMVIAYSVAGGFIFQHLEKYNEQQECVQSRQNYLELEGATMFRLWDIATKFRSDEYQEFALDEYQIQLESFRNGVLSHGYDGTNCTAMDEDGPPGYQWSFPGALLFSVTVITTIGYGHIAPKTFWGRLVCIAYATLGIPLMLMCLANIGDVMADIFRFIYTKMCCCGCCRPVEKKQEGQQQQKEGSTPESWKTTFQKPMADPTTGALVNVTGPIVLDDDEDEWEYEDEDDETKISIPLTITLGVIAGYIFSGAFLFGLWEDWDLLKASYFCFVTISTIGFGDVVPGSANFENAEDQWKMVGAAFYMLFGMAILSMCFSLIQEEIVAKFRWVGEKIGILEKNKSSEAEEEEGEGEIEGGESSLTTTASGEEVIQNREETLQKQKMDDNT